MSKWIRRLAGYMLFVSFGFLLNFCAHGEIVFDDDFRKTISFCLFVGFVWMVFAFIYELAEDYFD